MANISVLVTDGNNIAVEITPVPTQVITIDRGIAGPVGPPGPAGSVTSVALTAPALFTVSGSPITSTGTLALTYSGSALPVANGGTGLTSYTANGVVYASGTGTLASGSALVFDGTNLGIGTSLPSTKLHVAKSGAISQTGLQAYFSDTGANNSRLTLGATNTVSAFITGGSTVNPPFVWYTNDGTVEQMRLDSSGNLGIGTSSPGSKLQTVASSPTRGIVSSTSASGSTGSQLLVTQTGIEDWVIGQPAGVSAFAFWSGRNTANDGVERMRLDSSGNLGLGVTPSAWSASAKAIQFGNYAGIYQNASGLAEFSFNSYQNTSNVETYRVSANTAAKYQIGAGTHKWFTAPSGTAGNAITFTQAMTLDASGNLGLGVTPSAWAAGFRALDVGTSSALVGSSGQTDLFNNAYFNGTNTVYKTTNAASLLRAASGGSFQWFNAPSGTAGDPITFTQAMTLDASGNLGIGTASPSSKLEVRNSVAATTSLDSTAIKLSNALDGGSGIEFSNAVAGKSKISFGVQSSGGGTDDTYIGFSTSLNGGALTEKMRLDSSGNLNIANLTASKPVFTDASKNLTSTGTVPVVNGGTGLSTIAALSIPVANTLNTYSTVTPTAGQSIRINAGATAWEAYTPAAGGSVTSVSVVSANGFAGTVATATTTPAITLSTSITGVIKGNGTAISAATAGTDYVAPGTATTFTAAQSFTASGILLKGSSTGYTTFTSANASATNYTVTVPAETMTVGYRNIPAVGTKTASYTLAIADVGKYVQVGTGGSITIPTATFAEGDIVSVFNNTAAAITITCTITTAYIAGTDADRATVSLATRGVATILFISGTVCVISGNVS